MKQIRRGNTKREALNNRLRCYRLKRHLSQREVAVLIGHKHAGHLCTWESGKCVPTLKSALKLSAAINCPVEVLFFPMWNQLRQEVINRRKQLESIGNNDQQKYELTRHNG
jgi:DNA-binding XRE family transcriptional regulator